MTRVRCDARLLWFAIVFFYFRQIRTQSTWIFQLFHLSKWDLVFIYCCSKWRPYYLALNDNAPYRSKHSDKSRKTLTRRLTLSLSLSTSSQKAIFSAWNILFVGCKSRHRILEKHTFHIAECDKDRPKLKQKTSSLGKVFNEFILLAFQLQNVNRKRLLSLLSRKRKRWIEKWTQSY